MVRALVTAIASHPVGALPAPSRQALAVEAQLKTLLGGRVSHTDQDRLSYARDMWPLALLWVRAGRTPPPPDLICWPKTEAEVTAIIALGRKERLALIPFGAGSGVCGGIWALHGGITIDLKRFDTIGEVDERHHTVDVGAGVMGETLERRLNARGWTLGHFPSSIYMSTVGGWLAARSAGQLSSKYGKIEDMVASVTFITGTGEKIVTPERPFSGPDLAQVLIGSEGTLGIFTSARLRVFPLATGQVFHGFEFKSVNDGLEAIRQIFRAGLRPAVTRLYDPFDTAIVGKGKPSTHKAEPGVLKRDIIPALLRVVAPQTLGRPKIFNYATKLFSRSRLILMFEGDAARCAEEDRAARAICAKLGAADLGEEPGKHWYAKRYDVSYRMSKVIDAGAFADTMEVATTWDKVYAVYERVHVAASQHAFVLCHFSHAYLEGCSLYFSFVGSANTQAELLERYDALWRDALSAATSAGANVSHHHGVGIVKARALQDSLNEGRTLLAALKRHFDPDGVMNPGKLGLNGMAT
jgi:alkyldihydroxyacetonephosphate synthase